jgi:hypothetical protein
MRGVLFAVLLALLSLAPFGRGAPVNGTSWAYEKVPAGTVRDGVVTEPGSLNFTKTYVAGQRACVVVIGDHKPVVKIAVKVYDAKNNLVAHDEGDGPAKDFVAVMWYPPRQEAYRIEIFSFGDDYNQCSVAFK